jgi:hypothetical protein
LKIHRGNRDNKNLKIKAFKVSPNDQSRTKQQGSGGTRNFQYTAASRTIEDIKLFVFS